MTAKIDDFYDDVMRPVARVSDLVPGRSDFDSLAGVGCLGWLGRNGTGQDDIKECCFDGT